MDTPKDTPKLRLIKGALRKNQYILGEKPNLTVIKGGGNPMAGRVNLNDPDSPLNPTQFSQGACTCGPSMRGNVNPECPVCGWDEPEE